MNYLTIFDEVVDIMRTDYSGYEIKKDWGNHEYYRNILEKELEGGLSRESFTEIVREYLLDFKDGHVAFIDKQRKSKSPYYGFEVRRFEDSLIIFNSLDSIPINNGMRIIKLGSLNITDASELYSKYFMSSDYERQNWNLLLHKFETITVKDDDGKTFEYALRSMEKEKSKKEKYTYEIIDDNTGIITLADFMDAVLMKDFIQKNKTAIEKRKNLIIDVRKNGGGLDDVFYLLFDYIFPEGTSMGSILDEEYEMKTLITKRTFKNRKKLLENNINDENRSLFESYFDFMKNSIGKGLVSTDVDMGALKDKIVGSSTPENVVVMTDVNCGSSGDQFAIYCKKSPKVTLLGRNTRGIIDYSNVGFEQLQDDFQIMYPTSVNERVLFNKGYDNIGVPVDTHVPWTPAHLTEDMDLKEALKVLKTSH